MDFPAETKCADFEDTETILRSRGFNFVQHLIQQLTDIMFCVQGGSAGFLHALHRKRRLIELNDIDILVRSDDCVANTNIRIINCLNQICSDQIYIKYEPYHGNSLYYIYINDILLNFFVNEPICYYKINIEHVFNIHVIAFQDILMGEKIALTNALIDVKYYSKKTNTTDQNTAEYQQLVEDSKGKVRRKKQFVDLFSDF
jgi:hypothetical protein